MNSSTSDKQKLSSMILFTAGSLAIFAPGLEAKQDAWLAIILSTICVIPIIYIYARIQYLFQNKDLFYIIEICFGKLISKMILIIFIFYTYYWTGDVLNNYGFYITISNLDATPKIIPVLFLSFLCTWVIKAGIDVLYRWTEVFVLFFLIFCFIIVCILANYMNIYNILPILYDGFKPLLTSIFSTSSALTQMIVFLMCFSNFETKKSSYKIYFTFLLIEGLFLTFLSLINILVLGYNHTTMEQYPSLAMIKKVQLSTTFQRIEIFLSASFLVGGFTKISILLFCFCKSVSKFFGFDNYKFIIIPCCLLIINLSYFQYDSVISYTEFNSKIWHIFFFPFQIILPIIIWIFAEIKVKKTR